MGYRLCEIELCTRISCRTVVAVHVAFNRSSEWWFFMSTWYYGFELVPQTPINIHLYIIIAIMFSISLVPGHYGLDY